MTLPRLSCIWAGAEGEDQAIVGMLEMTHCSSVFPTRRGTDWCLGEFLLQSGNL